MADAKDKTIIAQGKIIKSLLSDIRKLKSENKRLSDDKDNLIIALCDASRGHAVVLRTEGRTVPQYRLEENCAGEPIVTFCVMG